jgi:fructuronate reductase/mannitol 2-dehydrogenase
VASTTRPPADRLPGPTRPARAEPLNARTLARHAPRVQVPAYDRRALTPAVVHIGVGGFARSHLLVHLDELAGQVGSGWGVTGVGLHTPAMREALAPQDNLYTVVERDAGRESARVVAAMVDYVFAPDTPGGAVPVLADPCTRLVTLTVTGTTYRVDPATGAYDPDEEARADLRDPHRPRSVFGSLVEGLDRRRRAGLPPFTVLSCDNMLGNGDAARTAVVGHARLRDEVLARWIADHVAFPNSMVDRITPSTGPGERAHVARTFGVDDRWPVVCEPYSSWVVEDSFCNGRPPLERVGVRVVPDVGGHEVVKTRLLNGTHTALGHLGRLAGLGGTAEVMADGVLREYAGRLMAQEIAPQLHAPEGVDLAAYQRTVLHRFANPAIGDRLERLCRRSSTKVPNYLLPSLHAALRDGLPHRLLVLAVAGWFRYLLGRDDDGRPIVVEDPRAEELTALARSAGGDPRPLLRERSLFGDLAEHPHLADAVAADLRSLERRGVRATVAAHLAARGHAPAAPALGHTPRAARPLPPRPLRPRGRPVPLQTPDRPRTDRPDRPGEDPPRLHDAGLPASGTPTPAAVAEPAGPPAADGGRR